MAQHLRNNKSKRSLRSNSGSAIIETMPIVLTLLILLRVSFGFWGAVHSGILNSIAAYNHALTTYAFRADLTYLRPGLIDEQSLVTSGARKSYDKSKSRYHGVIDENKPSSDNKTWFATPRAIGLDRYIATAGNTPTDLMTNQCPGCTEVGITDPLHRKNSELYAQTSDQNKRWTQFVWIKTVYGICLNVKCEQ